MQVSLRLSEAHIKYAILYVPLYARVIRSCRYSVFEFRSGTVSQRRRILRTIHLSGIRRLWYGKKGSAIRKVVKKEEAEYTRRIRKRGL